MERFGESFQMEKYGKESNRKNVQMEKIVKGLLKNSRWKIR
jgi:hypothetical protein